MAIEYNGKNDYLNGCQNFRKDYEKARYFLNMAYQDPDYRFASISKLMQIDLKEGKYAHVRSLLQENEHYQSIELNHIYGLLENIENNFETSKKYYGACMVDSSRQPTALLALAKLYIQTGDYNVARKMLETVQLFPDFSAQATIGLICLNILEQNYKEAYQMLPFLEQIKKSVKLQEHYKILNTYLLYLMGKICKSNANNDVINHYMLYRLFDDHEKILLQHLSKHLYQKQTAQKKVSGRFFRNTDLKNLLHCAREKIEKMNANHFELSDMYRFKLDHPIGFVGDDITSDLCVVTLIGTKNIVTMYPVLLSNQFDKEGMSFSKELMLKRTCGGNHYDK